MSCSFVGQWDFNLSVKSSWPEKGRIENIWSVCGHDNLDSSQIIKTVQLVEKFHEGSLDLSVCWATLAEPSATDGINFIHKNDTGLILFGIAKHLPDDSCWLSDVFINNSWSNDFQELGFNVTCKGSCDQGFSSTRRTVHKATLIMRIDTFWRFDSDSFEKFRISYG